MGRTEVTLRRETPKENSPIKDRESDMKASPIWCELMMGGRQICMPIVVELSSERDTGSTQDRFSSCTSLLFYSCGRIVRAVCGSTGLLCASYIIPAASIELKGEQPMKSENFVTSVHHIPVSDGLKRADVQNCEDTNSLNHLLVATVSNGTLVVWNMDTCAYLGSLHLLAGDSRSKTRTPLLLDVLHITPCPAAVSPGIAILQLIRQRGDDQNGTLFPDSSAILSSVKFVCVTKCNQQSMISITFECHAVTSKDVVFEEIMPAISAISTCQVDNLPTLRKCCIATVWKRSIAMRLMDNSSSSRKDEYRSVSFAAPNECGVMTCIAIVRSPAAGDAVPLAEESGECASMRFTIASSHAAGGEIFIWHDLSLLQGLSKTEACEVSVTHKISPPCSLLHWHAHPVTALLFCSDGRTLCSGGEEGVLVVWNEVQKGLSRSFDKSFYPRLGASISGLVIDSQVRPFSPPGGAMKVVVLCSDNSFRVVKIASMRETFTIGMPFTGNCDAGKYRFESSSDNDCSCKLAVDSQSGLFLCNGQPGSLQMFACAEDGCPELRSTLRVADYIRVSRKESLTKLEALSIHSTDQDRSTYLPCVTHFASISFKTSIKTFNGNGGNGYIIVTVDVRRVPDLDGPETSLKFWEWSDLSRTYRLSAQIDSPHGAGGVASETSLDRNAHSGEVTSLAICSENYPLISTSSRTRSSSGTIIFRQRIALAATASRNGSVKCWRAERDCFIADAQPLTAESSNNIAIQSNITMRDSFPTVTLLPLSWTCCYSFQYRDSPAAALSFSTDGSLLAVAHDSMISLWQPKTISFKASYVHRCTSTDDSAWRKEKPCSVISTAFIEPHVRSHGSCGNGFALLVVASWHLVSVVDLLSMSTVWSLCSSELSDSINYFQPQNCIKRQKIASVSCAKNVDDAIFLEPPGTTSNACHGDIFSEAWVALALNYECEEHQRNETYSGIFLFSPLRKVPLAFVRLNDATQSLSFCGKTLSGFRGGLSVVTMIGSIYLLSAQKPDAEGSSKVKEGKSLVHVPSLKVARTNVGNGNSSQLDISAHIDKSSANFAINAQSIFHESSDRLPVLDKLTSQLFRQLCKAVPRQSDSKVLRKRKLLQLNESDGWSWRSQQGVSKSFDKESEMQKRWDRSLSKL